MKNFAAPVLAATAVIYASAVSGWQFTYVDPTGKTYIVRQSTYSNRACTPINHAAGKVVVWDRGDTTCCINLYNNTACSGTPQGTSCPDWAKATSIALYSFSVTGC
jgi:hypothetical protein